MEAYGCRAALGDGPPATDAPSSIPTICTALLPCIAVQVSEYASYSVTYYRRIIEAALDAAGAPRDLVQIVTGYGDAGAALVNGGVDKVIFVGSTVVGKKVGGGHWAVVMGSGHGQCSNGHWQCSVLAVQLAVPVAWLLAAAWCCLCSQSTLRHLQAASCWLLWQPAVRHASIRGSLTHSANLYPSLFPHSTPHSSLTHSANLYPCPAVP